MGWTEGVEAAKAAAVAAAAILAANRVLTYDDEPTTEEDR